MTEIENHIKKTSKTLSILLNILRVCLFVAIGFELVAILGTILFHPVVDELFTIGTVHFHAPLVKGYDGTTAEMIVEFSTNILRQGIVIAMLFLSGAIFRDISRDYSPFMEKHTVRLKVISLLMVALTIIPPPIQMLLTQILAPHVDAAADFSLYGIIFAIIFYCLAQIFHYRCSLQKQADETL